MTTTKALTSFVIKKSNRIASSLKPKNNSVGKSESDTNKNVSRTEPGSATATATAGRDSKAVSNMPRREGGKNGVKEPGKLTIYLRTIPEKLTEVSVHMLFSGICLIITIIGTACGVFGVGYLGPQYFTFVVLGSLLLNFII